MRQDLSRRINRVVDSGNCSGCGVCASLFAGVDMELSQDGFMRPVVLAGMNAINERDSSSLFDSMCPGRKIDAPEVEPGSTVHPIFGRAVGVWEGWSTDADIRSAGSSGGVLTSISAFLSARSGKPAQMVGMDAERPTRTVTVRITSREEALKAAGSRYAPVAAGSGNPDNTSSFTGKPCEISALRSATVSADTEPLLLSFFCAGTPSQLATERLIRGLDHDVENVTSTKYRGDGWPGKFVVKSADGTSASKSYEESWGEVLGKQLQDRCKICVDGTGEAADIAVGDFWASDESGYPKFEDQDGRSVVIARTSRGLRVLEECVRYGLIELRPINLDEVARIQPLQVRRRLTLPGRLMGRVVTGRPIPSYGGYSLTILFLRHLPSNLRAAVGTVRRAVKLAKKSS